MIIPHNCNFYTNYTNLSDKLKLIPANFNIVFLIKHQQYIDYELPDIPAVLTESITEQEEVSRSTACLQVALEGRIWHTANRSICWLMLLLLPSYKQSLVVCDLFGPILIC